MAAVSVVVANSLVPRRCSAAVPSGVHVIGAVTLSSTAAMSAEASIGLRVYPLVKLEEMCHAQSDIAERRGCHVRLEQVIGHRMRERREEMALTQEQAGQRSGGRARPPGARAAVRARVE